MKKIFLSLCFISLLPLSVVLSQNQPKIGLVLSGGGALGYAHIGVIKALEEYNNVAERDLTTETRYKPIQKETQEMLNMQFYWE